MAKVAVVGEQQQPLAVIVETAHRVHALFEAVKQIHHGFPALRIADRGHAVHRLVQREIEQTLGGAQHLAIDFDVVAIEIGLRAKFGDGRSVDHDAALGHERLGLAPRGDAGAGENLLEAFFGH